MPPITSSLGHEAHRNQRRPQSFPPSPNRRARTRAAAALCVSLLAGSVLAATTWPAVAATSTVALPASWHKGANLTSWWFNEWEQPSTDASLSALRATNSTQAAFVTTWYMSSPTASTMAPNSQKTPTDAGLLRAMARSSSLGLRPVLKLHVDVNDGSWRGTIRPTSPTLWFASYRTMVERYASLAQRAGAQMLIVGTELSSMAGYQKDWRTVIASARSRFSGQLTFAANWIEGARGVAFWDALDYVAIDAYMPLASNDNPNPSIDQLVASWRDRGYVAEITRLQAQWRKPVLFTEVGYQSRRGTAVTPSDARNGTIDQEPQRRAFEALYRVWAPIPWFQGIYLWDWTATGYDARDGNFNPRGKAAEATITAWNAGTVQAPQQGH